VAAAEPDLPWFDRLPPPEAVAAPELFEAEPAPAARSAEAAAHDEARAPAPEHDDDLFDRRDPFPLHVPAAPDDEVGGRETPSHVADHEASPRAPDQVPDWAWPSALDRPTEAAPASEERHEPPEPRRMREPLRLAPSEARASEPAAAPPPAPRPLDPDAARALGNIRRLMLVSNLFMVVAIGAVLAVVGYRLFRTEPAAPPAPPPTPAAKPVLAAIPNDMTLTLPRGARIVETAVAGDRLVITIEIGGATEIRTFDVKTLQPTGRLSFATVP